MSIQFYDWLLDKKINGINVSISLSIESYMKFAPAIITKNELQRKRVKSTGKTYQLLAKDLQNGCIIPPIILALSNEASGQTNKIVKECVIKNTIDQNDRNLLQAEIEKSLANNHVLILDGLQRTYTIKDCVENPNIPEEFLKKTIRAEIYIGLSKVGILYRMITLNTGQNPMSLRHQIEMLYQDYLDKDSLTEYGIVVHPESEGNFPPEKGHYKFSDVADMYYSYTMGSSTPNSKASITSTLQEQDFLESYSDEKSTDLIDLLRAYNKFSVKLHEHCGEWEFSKRFIELDSQGDELNESDDDINPDLQPDFEKISTPFGQNVSSILSKGQILTGFGAACRKLLDQKLYPNLDEINIVIDGIDYSESRKHLDMLTILLNEVKSESKKVGDSQREFFYTFFKQLFFKDGDAFKQINSSLLKAKSATEIF